MTEIAFVTTCKGRLHHLKVTMPLLSAQMPDELVVVDYGCPDHVGDWVEANIPSAKVVRVTDDPAFCVSRARNIGVNATSAEWLAMIDGDVKVAPGWRQWMKLNLRPGHFYIAAPKQRRRVPDTFGTVILMRKDFDAVGGYDEVFRGWGGEDRDLYQRLRRLGVVQADYPSGFVEAIEHPDQERADFAGLKDRTQKLIANMCYSAAKTQLALLSGGDLAVPLNVRQRLMDVTVGELKEWFAQGAQRPLEIRHNFGRSNRQVLGQGLQIQSELTFTVRVSPAGPAVTGA